MSDVGPLVCPLVTLFSTNFSTITKEATAITSDVITIINEVITITREVATIKFWILGMTNQGENGSSLHSMLKGVGDPLFLQLYFNLSPKILRRPKIFNHHTSHTSQVPQPAWEFHVSW